MGISALITKESAYNSGLSPKVETTARSQSEFGSALGWIKTCRDFVMLNLKHHDARVFRMRTTVTLADDVAASVEELRRERGVGLSEAVNDLVRAGLTAKRPTSKFRQEAHDLGRGLDVSNIGELIETLDGPIAR